MAYLTCELLARCTLLITHWFAQIGMPLTVLPRESKSGAAGEPSVSREPTQVCRLSGTDPTHQYGYAAIFSSRNITSATAQVFKPLVLHPTVPADAALCDCCETTAAVDVGNTEHTHEFLQQPLLEKG